MMYNYIMQPYIPQGGRAPGTAGTSQNIRAPGTQMDESAIGKNPINAKPDKEMSFGMGLNYDQKLLSETTKTTDRKSSLGQGFSTSNQNESHDSVNSMERNPNDSTSLNKNLQNQKRDDGDNMIEQAGFNRNQLRISVPSLDVTLGKSSVPKGSHNPYPKAIDVNNLVKSPGNKKHGLLDDAIFEEDGDARHSRKNSVSNISRNSRGRKGSENFDADGNPSKPLEIKLFESSLGGMPQEEKPNAGYLGKRSFDDMDQEESGSEEDLFQNDADEKSLSDQSESIKRSNKKKRKELKTEQTFPDAIKKEEENDLEVNKKTYHENINKVIKEKANQNETGPDLQNNEELLDAENDLNSDDDVTDDEEPLDFGRNILLAYYDKNNRKRDRRKITFKHCVLRINDAEYLIPQARGDFNWIASNRRHNNFN